ncbi:MFS transporter [Exophiala viscosa]|uniref:MFS transporter n=1 Tax=Exophiala viscosa TaxID=2486360 RepID=A0AAN6DRK1_9EURO|nr:MFS transporter [Exophiala viscosa]
MANPIRDTSAGQLLRAVGFKSWLAYPEELPSFEPQQMPAVPETLPVTNIEDLEKTLSKIATKETASNGLTSESSSEKDVGEAIVVSWTSNDKDNPRNWSQGKKMYTLTLINLYTFVVYLTASIITPTAEFIVKRYDVSIVMASLGLSMYVVGYGLGPMFFSPLSEVAWIGRNPPYLYSFIVSFAMSIALCFVDNFPGIIVLRFLQGFFGSPCLASGAASIEDVYDIYSAPYGYIFWVGAMYCGPAFGPLLAGYAVVSNWRWPLYEVVIMASIILMFLPFLPETNPNTILLSRAKRLRKATGNKMYLAVSELKPLRFGAALTEAMIKPLEISVKDPAIAYACIYGALVYATYYSFFEAFPLVYLGVYRMSLGAMGLIFAGLVIGCVVAIITYAVYLRHYFIPRSRKYHEHRGHPVEQEEWLRPGLIGVWGLPVGLLIFAWTARSDIHWIVPTIGISIFATTSFWTFQSLVCYVALAYPRYVASLFAANDFCRSMTAAAFVQFSRQMYMNLGIGKGVTLVAGLSVIGIIGMHGLYSFGPYLRAKSKFTG